jgi:hypothetical protein
MLFVYRIIALIPFTKVDNKIRKAFYENLRIYFYQDKIEINDSIAIKALDEYYENRNDIPFTVSFANGSCY